VSRERRAEGEVVVWVHQRWRDGGRAVGLSRGPLYVHVDVCLIPKEGESGSGSVLGVDVVLVLLQSASYGINAYAP
jgi:hypothetical protein